MKKIKIYLSLIRWPNLLIMALILIVLRFGFLKSLGFDVYLSDGWHALFILATILIAAGGNVVNDSFDTIADSINKPEKQLVGKVIGKEDARFVGQVLLFIGVLTGLAMGYFNDMLTFSYIFPLSALLLWAYAANLKRQPFIGNLTVAFLAALMVANEIIFDILKTYSPENAEMQRNAILVISAFSGFAFVTTLCREIIKDIQDINGDEKAGYKTLPITSGTLFPKILVIFLVMLITVAIGWMVRVTGIGGDYISAAYLIFALIIPLLLIMVRTAPANTRKQLGQISNLFKWVMVAGILALVVFTLSYKLSLPEPEQQYDIRIDAVH